MSLDGLRERDSLRPINPRVPIEDSPLRMMMRKAIFESGLTYGQLGVMTGLSKSTIANLVNGTREGRIETWEIILKALNIEIGYRVKEKE